MVRIIETCLRDAIKPVVQSCSVAPQVSGSGPLLERDTFKDVFITDTLQHDL